MTRKHTTQLRDKAATSITRELTKTISEDLVQRATYQRAIDDAVDRLNKLEKMAVDAKQEQLKSQRTLGSKTDGHNELLKKIQDQMKEMVERHEDHEDEQSRLREKTAALKEEIQEVQDVSAP